MTTSLPGSESSEKSSQLIAALREGVAVVQMVLFKEVRNLLTKKMTSADTSHISMLAGSITNEAFGTRNPEKKFVQFRENNRADIEQGLLSIKEDLTSLCPTLTDALRIQTLCDHQEGADSSKILEQAKDFGFLKEEREIPLPSTFMTVIRMLGEKHNLIVPPVQITPAQDESMVH